MNFKNDMHRLVLLFFFKKKTQHAGDNTTNEDHETMVRAHGNQNTRNKQVRLQYRGARSYQCSASGRNHK